MTACAIGVQQGDMFVGIYVHQNGEPENVGAILDKYYDCVRSNTLVRYGDVYELGATIGSIHTAETVIPTTKVQGIETPVPDETTFYGRDLGDTELTSEQFFNADKLKDFYTKHRGSKHVYVRVKRGWMYYVADSDDWVSVSDVLEYA
jgi:hypothetical protein